MCLFIYFIIIFETRSCSEAQAGLGLTSILLPQPSECWNCRREQYAQPLLLSFTRWVQNGCQAQKPVLTPSPFLSALQTAAHSFEHSGGSVAAFQVALSVQKSSRGDSGKVRRKMQLPSLLQRGQEKT